MNREAGICQAGRQRLESAEGPPLPTSARAWVQENHLLVSQTDDALEVRGQRSEGRDRRRSERTGDAKWAEAVQQVPGLMAHIIGPWRRGDDRMDADGGKVLGQGPISGAPDHGKVELREGGR
jgi:hypothetical protein